ncbi:hypothetical protein J6590_051333 [Homalodisca vitripennis]|nr:hypothetical protein J6590_051333 [Homalodisca vitripennis]
MALAMLQSDITYNKWCLDTTRKLYIQCYIDQNYWNFLVVTGITYFGLDKTGPVMALSRPRESLNISAPNWCRADMVDGVGSVSGNHNSWVSRVVSGVDAEYRDSAVVLSEACLSAGAATYTVSLYLNSYIDIGEVGVSGRVVLMLSTVTLLLCCQRPACQQAPPRTPGVDAEYRDSAVVLSEACLSAGAATYTASLYLNSYIDIGEYRDSAVVLSEACLSAGAATYTASLYLNSYIDIGEVGCFASLMERYTPCRSTEVQPHTSHGLSRCEKRQILISQQNI